MAREVCRKVCTVTRLVSTPRTRTRTNTIPYGTEANAAGEVGARAWRVCGQTRESWCGRSPVTSFYLLFISTVPRLVSAPPPSQVKSRVTRRGNMKAARSVNHRGARWGRVVPRHELYLVRLEFPTALLQALRVVPLFRGSSTESAIHAPLFAFL